MGKRYRGRQGFPPNARNHRAAASAWETYLAKERAFVDKVELANKGDLALLRSAADGGNSSAGVVYLIRTRPLCPFRTLFLRRARRSRSPKRIEIAGSCTHDMIAHRPGPKLPERFRDP